MKKYILFLILALFINIISADLILIPSELSIENTLNQPKTYSFTMTNTYDFTLRTFTFSNLTDFNFPSITLITNQTINVSFIANSNTIQKKDINSLVTFNYLVNVPSEPQTHLITINPNGFSPNFLAIHQDDTVTWKNLDTISHTVTSSFFDSTLTPNQTYSKTFTDIQNINYQD